jgi:hypothetical protein
LIPGRALVPFALPFRRPKPVLVCPQHNTTMQELAQALGFSLDSLWLAQAQPLSRTPPIGVTIARRSKFRIRA